MIKLSLEEGRKRGFHSGYTQLNHAEGIWEWNGNGWTLKEYPMADNTNPSAQSEESTRVFGDSTSYSINEPLVDEPQAFKIPEGENITTEDNLLLAYPEGYVPPE